MTDRVTEAIQRAITGGDLTIRDEAERIVDVRLLTYDEVAETDTGPEYHEAGAFEDVDPSTVVFRMDHQDPALGRGVSIEDRDGAPHMAFRIDATTRGDDLLAGIASGTYQAVSVGESLAKRAVKTVRRDGRRMAAITRSGLAEVSATWRPAYATAAVLAVRNEAEEIETMAEQETAEATAATADTSAIEERLSALEERQRADAIVVPEPADYDTSSPRGVRLAPEIQRALADVVTTDNAGVIPEARSSEMIGIIDNARPFLESTRRLDTPPAGTKLVVPVLEQRPLVGEQMTEKAEVASRKTIISETDFDMRTFAGAGDLSIQVIKRSSPQFLALWEELLAEDYSIKTDDAAVDALLAATGINAGMGAFDPATGDLNFGESYVNAQAISRRMFPNTLWVSTAVVAELIDAKTQSGGAGVPLYGGLSINADANGGVSGTVSGLRLVHVPALDNEAVDAIVGPSRGFAWAEDGTYVLQADVPAKAGRDVGLVGMVWFAPMYPEAFTTYALGS